MPEKNNICLMNPGHFFPDQLAVYPIGNQEKINNGNPSLLHSNFKTPLSNKDVDQLMYEIADYLKDKEKGTVYSFFTKFIKGESPDIKWQLKCCRLNKNTKEQPTEVVIFTYDLELLGDVKKRLYRLLENEGYFKENLEKIAMLTKREKEIIGFLSQGMSNKQIAGISYTSVHTVNTHRQHINKKLATKNLPELLKIADAFDLTCNKTKV